MSEDYAEKLIAQMSSLPGTGRPLPRWFRANQQASFAVLRRFYKTAPPRTIYHYTSTAALISIVANNELWLSEATFLNDRHEIEIGRQLAISRVRAKIAEEEAPEVRAMLQAAVGNFDRWTDPEVYVACFSFEGDDLAQWRAYGGGDAPVAIEFEHGPFMFGYTSEGVLERVFYEPEDQVWTFDQVLAAYTDSYRDDVRDPVPVERKGPPLTRDEENDSVASMLYHALWRTIVICKDPAFRSEREVRFIYRAHDYGQSAKGWHPEHPIPQFRERAGRVIPYLSSKSLDFRNMKRLGDPPKLPIRSIRIGPTDEPGLIERGVRRLLDAHGHDEVALSLSDAPFRPR